MPSNGELHQLSTLPDLMVLFICMVRRYNLVLRCKSPSFLVAFHRGMPPFSLDQVGRTTPTDSAIKAALLSRMRDKKDGASGRTVATRRSHRPSHRPVAQRRVDAKRGCCGPLS